MAKYAYPAVFTPDGELYTVHFPDFECCYTQGNGIVDAMEMAQDVLCLTLYDMEEKGIAIPVPSDVRGVTACDGGFVSLVTCDTVEYRKFYDSKAVKKTLTIPSWLNTMAERQGVNFSQILQDALREKVGA